MAVLVSSFAVDMVLFTLPWLQDCVVFFLRRVRLEKYSKGDAGVWFRLQKSHLYRKRNGELESGDVILV